MAHCILTGLSAISLDANTKWQLWLKLFWKCNHLLAWFQTLWFISDALGTLHIKGEVLCGKFNNLTS